MIRPFAHVMLSLSMAAVSFGHAFGDDSSDEAQAKPVVTKQEKAKRNSPLERTRRTVRMLDDIYKGGIVAITKNYVTDEDAIPAGTAFKEVFQTAEKNGWHKVRLVDGLGEPINDENAPADAFEKKALAALVAGKTNWYEKVEKNAEGTRTLRVATPIPVVFEKCIMCHDNYADVPAGQAIGALTYAIEIK